MGLGMGMGLLLSRTESSRLQARCRDPRALKSRPRGNQSLRTYQVGACITVRTHGGGVSTVLQLAAPTGVTTCVRVHLPYRYDRQHCTQLVCMGTPNGNTGGDDTVALSLSMRICVCACEPGRVALQRANLALEWPAHHRPAISAHHMAPRVNICEKKHQITTCYLREKFQHISTSIQRAAECTYIVYVYSDSAAARHGATPKLRGTQSSRVRKARSRAGRPARRRPYPACPGAHPCVGTNANHRVNAPPALETG